MVNNKNVKQYKLQERSNTNVPTGTRMSMGTPFLPKNIYGDGVPAPLHPR